MSATQLDEKLFVVDSMTSRLLTATPDGDWGELDDYVSEIITRNRPVMVRSVEDDLLLQFVSPHSLVRLESQRHLRLLDAVNVRVEREDGFQIHSTWIWEPLAKNELVTCSDVSRPGRDPVEAFVRIPLNEPNEFEVLLEKPLNSPLRVACRLALPLIATLENGSVYTLVPGDPSEISQIKPGPPKPLPISVGKWPQVDRDDLGLVMYQIEYSAMPIGLFGSGDQLYLLTRSPGESHRGTDWKLTEIDPSSGDRLATRKVPTRATHLLVAPGEEYWAFVEQGPVNVFGDQNVYDILWVPTRQIRGDGPLHPPPQ